MPDSFTRNEALLWSRQYSYNSVWRATANARATSEMLPQTSAWRCARTWSLSEKSRNFLQCSQIPNNYGAVGGRYLSIPSVEDDKVVEPMTSMPTEPNPASNATSCTEVCESLLLRPKDSEWFDLMRFHFAGRKAAGQCKPASGATGGTRSCLLYTSDAADE